MPRFITRAVAATMLAIALAVVAAGPAAAQSFDCAKATEPDERAICASRELSGKDIRMATLWWVPQQVPMMMGQRGIVEDAQAAFLKRRAACGGDTACIARAYDARIVDQEVQVKAQMQAYCKAIQLC